MAEAEALEDEEEEGVTIEDKGLRSTEDTYLSVLYIARRGEKQDDESESVIQPLLQHRQQDPEAAAQMATDGADPMTSVPRDPESSGSDHPRRGGSRSSSSSSSSTHECPICNELFGSEGDRSVALLNCNHRLCRHCVGDILKRAKDSSRVRCPFCRLTTPFPQWDILRMQEEYSSSVYDPGPPPGSGPVDAGPLDPGRPENPEIPARTFCCVPARRRTGASGRRNACGRGVCPSRCGGGLRLMGLHSSCISVTAALLLLLLLLLLTCFLYMIVPVMMLSALLKGP